jgi:hypothetical protein
MISDISLGPAVLAVLQVVPNNFPRGYVVNPTVLATTYAILEIAQTASFAAMVPPRTVDIANSWHPIVRYRGIIYDLQ